MITKILEIRDRATYLPVMATKMISDIPKERYHLRRTGYGEDFPLIRNLYYQTGNAKEKANRGHREGTGKCITQLISK